MSTRLSIRKRGSTGGHHQAMEIEDRFGHWRSEEVGDLIWGLGAMAAEHVFYGQNTTGVGGDLGSVTAQRRAHGRLPRRWRPAPIDLVRPDRATARSARRRRSASWSASRSSATRSCTARARHDRQQPVRRQRSATAASASSSPACSGRRSWSPTTPSRPTSDGTDYVAERLIDGRRALRRRRDRPARRGPARQARDRRPGRGRHGP